MLRLHITPFSPDLVSVILGSEVSKVAANITFHSLQTFPEKSYGYVDLPAMEAEKIKKKLSGAILKGKKIKVEEARPTKRKHVEDNAEEQTVQPMYNSPPPKKRKSKQDKNIISGHELPAERKVKRGWTETKSNSLAKKKDKVKSSAKAQPTSKYSEKEELLFKTVLPDNKASEGDGGLKRTKRKKTKDGSELVHEFENTTTIPSFLRNDITGSQNTVAYEDGQGWIDQNGETVEKENPKSSRRRQAARDGIEQEVLRTQPTRSTRPRQPQSIDQLADKHSVSPDETDSSDEDKNSTSEHHQELESAADDETSSSGGSTTDQSLEQSSDNSDMSAADDDAQSADATPPNLSIHPLEALFKKPVKPASSQNGIPSQTAVKPSLEVQTSFSFFERDDDNDLPTMPMTPFSSQDVRNRELRSAAPTPDTAHPSRMSSIFNGEESEGELSDMPEDADSRAVFKSQHKSSIKQNLEIPQTDFEKQFWEKRGENNRAWKARRRAVLKDNRQRENRSRRPRNW